MTPPFALPDWLAKNGTSSLSLRDTTPRQPQDHARGWAGTISTARKRHARRLATETATSVRNAHLPGVQNEKQEGKKSA
jgi:hypothetical protein